MPWDVQLAAKNLKEVVEKEATTHPATGRTFTFGETKRRSQAKGGALSQLQSTINVQGCTSSASYSAIAKSLLEDYNSKTDLNIRLTAAANASQPLPTPGAISFTNEEKPTSESYKNIVVAHIKLGYALIENLNNSNLQPTMKAEQIIKIQDGIKELQTSIFTNQGPLMVNQIVDQNRPEKIENPDQKALMQNIDILLIEVFYIEDINLRDRCVQSLLTCKQTIAKNTPNTNSAFLWNSYQAVYSALVNSKANTATLGALYDVTTSLMVCCPSCASEIKKCQDYLDPHNPHKLSL